MARIPQPPPVTEENFDLEKLNDWAARLANQLAPMFVESKVIDPSSVAANSTETQSFTWTGVTTEQAFVLQKPSRTNNLNIVQVWCATNDTLSVAFENTSSGAVDAASETYRLVAIRV